MKKLIIAILIILAGFLGGCNALALPKPMMIEKLEICNIVCIDYEQNEPNDGQATNQQSNDKQSKSEQDKDNNEQDNSQGKGQVDSKNTDKNKLQTDKGKSQQDANAQSNKQQNSQNNQTTTNSDEKADDQNTASSKSTTMSNEQSKDQTNAQGKYTVSLGIKKAAKDGGAEGKSGSDKSGDIASGTAANLGDALGQVVQSRDLTVYFGDVETIILGESLMKAGIDKAIDFFIRSDKFNQFAKVYTTQGSAKDLLQKLTEEDMSDSIEQKANMDSSFSVFTTNLTLIDLMNNLQPNSSGVVPLVVEIKQDENTAFELEGLAVLKDKKQIGTLTKEETRGYNAIKNKIKNGTLGLSFDEYKAGVDNLTITTKTKVDVQNKQNLKELQINLDTKQSANISFVTDSASQKFDVEKQIEQKISEDITEDIISCLQKVYDLQCDFLGLLDTYRMWHKKEYNQIKDKDTLLQEIVVTIKSTADIKRGHQVRD